PQRSTFLCTAAAPRDLYPLSLHDALPIYLGAALITEAGDDVAELLADDLALPGRGGQDVQVFGDAPLDVVVLVDDLLPLQGGQRSEEHTSELQSRENLVCRLLLEKKNKHK